MGLRSSVRVYVTKTHLCLLLLWSLFLVYALIVYPNQYSAKLYLCRVTNNSPRCRTIRHQLRQCYIWVESFSSLQEIEGEGPLRLFGPSTSYEKLVAGSFLDCVRSNNGLHYAPRNTVQTTSTIEFLLCLAFFGALTPLVYWYGNGQLGTMLTGYMHALCSFLPPFSRNSRYAPSSCSVSLTEKYHQSKAPSLTHTTSSSSSSSSLSRPNDNMYSKPHQTPSSIHYALFIPTLFQSSKSQESLLWTSSGDLIKHS